MLKTSLILAAALTLAAVADPADKPAETAKPAAGETAKPPKKEKKAEDKKKEQKKEKEKARQKKEKAKPTPPARNKPAEKTEKPAEPESEPKSKEDKELAKAKAETERLTILNALAAEKSKHETVELRSEIARLKLEKELLTEKIAFAAAKQDSKKTDVIAKFMVEKEELTREATLAKLEAEKLSFELKTLQTESTMKTSELMAEISEIETQSKRDDYANAEPLYLDNPLKKDGTLVISDRRIPFNGPVTGALADRVTTRIITSTTRTPRSPSSSSLMIPRVAPSWLDIASSKPWKDPKLLSTWLLNPLPPPWPPPLPPWPRSHSSIRMPSFSTTKSARASCSPA